MKRGQLKMTKKDLKELDKILVSKGLEYNDGLAVYESDRLTVIICLVQKSYYLVIHSCNNNINDLMFDNLDNFKRFMKYD